MSNDNKLAIIQHFLKGGAEPTARFYIAATDDVVTLAGQIKRLLLDYKQLILESCEE